MNVDVGQLNDATFRAMVDSYATAATAGLAAKRALSPAMLAMADIAKSPTFRAANNLYTSATIKAMESLTPSTASIQKIIDAQAARRTSAAGLAAKLALSPTTLAMADIAKSPTLRAMENLTWPTASIQKIIDAQTARDTAAFTANRTLLDAYMTASTTGLAAMLAEVGARVPTEHVLAGLTRELAGAIGRNPPSIVRQESCSDVGRAVDVLVWIATITWLLCLVTLYIESLNAQGRGLEETSGFEQLSVGCLIYSLTKGFYSRADVLFNHLAA